jgi:hypothetical protein
MKKFYVATMIFPALIVSYFFYHSMFGISKPIAFTMLPKSAQDVHEFYTADGFHADYVYLIKAKIEPAEYIEYVNLLKMPIRYDININAELKSKLNTGYSGTPKWWDPPNMNEMSYYEYDDRHNFKDIVIYANGYVYYYSAKW